MNIELSSLRDDIVRAVRTALEEDLGDGDITAQLIPEAKTDTATIITREDCCVCGVAWVNEVFTQLGGLESVEWHVKDGERVSADTCLVTLKGNTRTLLTGERAALNFLQTLSGTSTVARHYADAVGNLPVRVLDTRKTIPGLRTAQKYAVATGGCHNHRIGLFDAYLIKENHIEACRGIPEAIQTARKLNPEKRIEVEVENLVELETAIRSGADIVMLDNFSPAMLYDAQRFRQDGVIFELSGNIDIDNLDLSLLKCVDCFSSGAITKHVVAIDLSMRIQASH